MFSEKKLNDTKSFLDEAPEVESYNVIEDGLEIWVSLKPYTTLSTPNAVKALQEADTFLIDFDKRMIIIYFYDEYDVPI